MARHAREPEPLLSHHSLTAREGKIVALIGAGKEASRFMAAEGALAIVKMSRNGNGLVHGEGRFYEPGNSQPLPEIEMAAEDDRRLARLAKVGDVKLEINSRTLFEDRELNGYNIIADIPGRDPKAGYIMAAPTWIAGWLAMVPPTMPPAPW